MPNNEENQAVAQQQQQQQREEEEEEEEDDDDDDEYYNAEEDPTENENKEDPRSIVFTNVDSFKEQLSVRLAFFNHCKWFPIFFIGQFF